MSGNNGSNNSNNGGGGGGGGGRNNQNNSNNGRSNQNNNSGGGRKRKKSRKKPKLDPVKYWGDPTSLPTRKDYVLDTPDPTAVIRSLGKAPIPGKNSAPELYFEVLYKRAAGLAKALAFAGGLNEDEPPSEDDPVEG